MIEKPQKQLSIHSNAHQDKTPSGTIRFVARTEYVLRKTLAISLSVGLSACGLGGALLLLGLPFGYYLDLKDAQADALRGPIDKYSSCISVSGLSGAFALWLCQIFLPVLLITALPLWLGSRKTWKTVRALRPIDFADTTALPEVETLVRASELPPAQQQAELLRAAKYGQETPPKDLLRVTNTNGYGEA